MTDKLRSTCPDCDGEMNRRDFVRVVGSTAAAAGAIPLLGSHASAAPTPKSTAETTVTQFYKTLSDEQKKAICFPFEHELRHRISANWHVTKPEIDSDFYTDEQRKLCDDIFRGLTSEEGYDRFVKQMDYDSGGFGAYSVAVFGEPGTGKFQWLLTGRHLTARADGDSVENVAFGGPIVYGHGEEDTKANVFHYQTKQANEVFTALDPKQREAALVEKAPKESDVQLQGTSGKFPGITVSQLSSDQRELVEKTIKVILAPYRTEDVEEALAILKSSGGFEKLHMAFYKQADLGNDQVWDIWRVEGPSFVWHFRGAPHVHTYANIGTKAT